ncbi:MAG: transglycosylase SLT domain-containing protein [Bacteriovoracaceae bacterium]|nr:transglycosylase SLT domain-containing protein [Bacteriovoracaceae bacterium]
MDQPNLQTHGQTKPQSIAEIIKSSDEIQPEKGEQVGPVKAVETVAEVSSVPQQEFFSSPANNQNTNSSENPILISARPTGSMEQALKRQTEKADEFTKAKIEAVNAANLARAQRRGLSVEAENLNTYNQETASNFPPKKVYYLSGAEELNLQNYYFDIPVTYNAAVKKWMHYFLNKGKPYFIRYTERAGRYAPVMGHILEERGMPRDLIFLAMAESGFTTNAKSWASAVGPWQFIPGTGRQFGLKMNWYMDERRDPIKATLAASQYLKELYEMFGSWELAAAGYNAGEGKVGKAIRRYGSDDFWTLTKKGPYLKPETKNYVPKIMALAILGKNLSSFGFQDIDFHEPLDFDEVEVPANTDLIALAEKAEIDFEEIQRLNPELLRWNTPPEIEAYHLRLPVGAKDVLENCCKVEDFSAHNTFTQITVPKKGSTLFNIAKRYRIHPQALVSINQNKGPTEKLSAGTLVYLPIRKDHSASNTFYAEHYRSPKKWKGKSYRYIKNISYKKRRQTSSKAQYYRVRKGDTLWDVSRKTGVPMERIIRSNVAKLDKGRGLKAGSKLIIR